MKNKEQYEKLVKALCSDIQQEKPNINNFLIGKNESIIIGLGSEWFNLELNPNGTWNIC